MDLIFESPWPFAGVGFCVAVIALLRFSAPATRWGLVGLGVLLIAAGFALDEYVKTDREQVEARVVSVVSAFQQNDADGMAALISPKQAALQQLARAAVAFVDLGADYRLTDIRLTREDDHITSHFRLNGKLSVSSHGEIGHKPTRWLVTWVPVEGDWLIDEVAELDPIRGDRLNRFNKIPGAR